MQCRWQARYRHLYIHRIGRTGRAGQPGRSILFHTEKETLLKDAIEGLMKYTIPATKWPKEVALSTQLAPEEQDKPIEPVEAPQKKSTVPVGAAYHEKSVKNSKPKVKKKTYSDKMKEKFGKPIRKGDKIQNRKFQNDLHR